MSGSWRWFLRTQPVSRQRLWRTPAAPPTQSRWLGRTRTRGRGAGIGVQQPAVVPAAKKAGQLAVERNERLPVMADTRATAVENQLGAGIGV